MKQSGQFVNLSNTQGTLGGKLRFEENAHADGSRQLTGDVLRQRRVPGVRRDGHPGDKGTIVGTLGGEPRSPPT